MVMLWILCVYFNRIILHKTQHCYSTKSAYFRTLIEFVATIDVIFSTIFMVYFVASLTPGLLHGNGSQSASPNRMCYELNKSVGEWFFNVVFTAGLVAMLRQSLLSMLYRKHKKCSQSHKANLKTIASHLFTVNTWRNSWALALLFLLLIGPWVATSAVMDNFPEAGKSHHHFHKGTSKEERNRTLRTLNYLYVYSNILSLHHAVFFSLVEFGDDEVEC